MSRFLVPASLGCGHRGQLRPRLSDAGKRRKPHCPAVRPGASWQFVDGGPGRNGTNCKGIRMPDAFIHSRQCYEPDPVWGNK